MFYGENVHIYSVNSFFTSRRTGAQAGYSKPSRRETKIRSLVLSTKTKLANFIRLTFSCTRDFSRQIEVGQIHLA